MIMLAKGNRSNQVTKACKQHGGFYLGSIGGPAAILAQNNIRKVEVLEYEVRMHIQSERLLALLVLLTMGTQELGMEAIWKIEVVDFPAFIVVDNKGNDFFKKWQQ